MPGCVGLGVAVDGPVRCGTEFHSRTPPKISRPIEHTTTTKVDARRRGGGNCGSSIRSGPGRRSRASMSAGRSGGRIASRPGSGCLPFMGSLQIVPQSLSRPKDVPAGCRRAAAQDVADSAGVVAAHVAKQEGGALVGAEACDRIQQPGGRLRKLGNVRKIILSQGPPPTTFLELPGSDAEGCLPDPVTRRPNRLAPSDALGERLRDSVTRHLAVVGEREQRAPQPVSLLAIEGVEIGLGWAHKRAFHVLRTG